MDKMFIEKKISDFKKPDRCSKFKNCLCVIAGLLGCVCLCGTIVTYVAADPVSQFHQTKYVLEHVQHTTEMLETLVQDAVNAESVKSVEELIWEADEVVNHALEMQQRIDNDLKKVEVVFEALKGNKTFDKLVSVVNQLDKLLLVLPNLRGQL